MQEARQDTGRRRASRRSLQAVADPELVGLARRGSRIAWDELVHRFRGLIAAIARHECLRLVGSVREQPVDPAAAETWCVPTNDPLDEVLACERRQAVLGALDDIPAESRRLLQLLIWDERSYQDISETVGIAVGSIGPTRLRALRRIARQPAVARLTSDRVPVA